MKRRTRRWVYEVIDETDDDALEFTDASAPSFLTDIDDDDEDDMDDYSSTPDTPDPITIGFRRSENKEPPS